MGGFWNSVLAWALWRRDKPLPSTGNRTTVPRTASPSLTRYTDRDVAASNVVCRECQIYLLTPSNKIKKNKMGWACSAYGGGERCAQGFGGEA
jgi:hypothetical protein